MNEEPSTPQDGSPFWRFSLQFYALPGIAPACVRLQDEAGADVNLLLFLLFLASEHREVSAEDVGRLDSRIAVWREEVVKPLRALRRRMKGEIGGVDSGQRELFRNRIKRAELEAEHIQQQALEKCAASLVPNPARAAVEIARSNLAAYSETAGGFPEREIAAILNVYQTLSV